MGKKAATTPKRVESKFVALRKLELKEISRDGGTQTRAEMNQQVIGEYAERMTAGDRFPPVTVFMDSEQGKLWLADGFHRVEAAEEAGWTHIEANVWEGDHRAAVLYSVGANRDHGLRRTNADKRRAVVRLLEDDEWSKWAAREIARRCGVDHKFVDTLRGELIAQGKATKPDKVKVERAGKVIEQSTNRKKPERKQIEKPEKEAPARAKEGNGDDLSMRQAGELATAAELVEQGAQSLLHAVEHLQGLATKYRVAIDGPRTRAAAAAVERANKAMAEVIGMLREEVEQPAEAAQ